MNIQLKPNILSLQADISSLLLFCLINDQVSEVGKDSIGLRISQVQFRWHSNFLPMNFSLL